MSDAVHRLLENTVSNTVFYIFGMALSFIIIPVLISTVGDEGYGLILLVGAITGYFSLAGLGVPGGSAKYIAEYDAKGDADQVYEIASTSVGFFLGIGVIVAVVLVGFVQFDALSLFVEERPARDEAARLFYVASAVAVIAWPTRALGSILSGLQQYHSLNIIRAVCKTASQISVIVVALMGGSLVAIYIAQEIFTIFKAMWISSLARKELGGRLPNPAAFSGAAFKMIFGLSVLILLNQIAGMLTYQTDKVIIGAALPVGMLSVYAILSKPAEIVRMVSGLFNSAIMPAVSAEQEKGGKRALDVFIYEGSRYNNALVAPFAVISTYLAEPFIRVWVGDKYLEWIWIAQLSCVFMLVWQSNSLLSRVYFGTGKAKKPAILALAVAVFNVILSVFLVQSLGVAGVLLATLIAGAVAVPLAYAFIFPDFEIDRWRYLTSVVFKAQWPSLALGLLLLPAWSWIQAVDSWPLFIAVGFATSVVFFPASFFNAVPQARRRFLYRWVVARVRRRRD